MNEVCSQPIDENFFLKVLIFFLILAIMLAVGYWLGRSHIKWQALFHGHANIDPDTKKFVWNEKPKG